MSSAFSIVYMNDLHKLTECLISVSNRIYFSKKDSSEKIFKKYELKKMTTMSVLWRLGLTPWTTLKPRHQDNYASALLNATSFGYRFTFILYSISMGNSLA